MKSSIIILLLTILSFDLLCQVQSTKLTRSPYHSQLSPHAKEIKDTMNAMKNNHHLGDLQLKSAKNSKIQLELGNKAYDGEGVATVNYEENEEGDVKFDLVYTTPAEDTKNNSNLYYSLSIVNGIIQLNITALQVANANSDMDGCTGFWTGTDATKLHDEDCEMDINNCFIYDTFTGKVLAFKSIDFKKTSGAVLKEYTWICQNQDGYWQFNFDICQWINLDKASLDL